MTSKKSFFDKLTGSVKMPNTEIGEEKPAISSVKRQDFKEEEEKEKSFFQIKPSVEDKPKKEEHKEEQVQENWSPATEGQLTIDVYQTPNEIIIKSTIAGVKPEDMDITITNDMVTIKGTRSRDEEIKDEDYFYQECYWGAFSRSVLLPVEVEAEKSTAHIKNGILTLRLPKAEKLKVKKIKVKSD